MMKMLAKCSLSLIVLLIAVTVSTGSPEPPQNNEGAFIEGTWALTNLAYPTQQRRITFDRNLGGFYHTDRDGPKRISNAIYKDGYLYFKIPDLKLYFEMRKVGERFDGKMSVYNSTERRVPDRVRLTRSR